MTFTDPAGCLGRGNYSGCNTPGTVCPIVYFIDSSNGRLSFVSVPTHFVPPSFQCPNVVVGCGGPPTTLTAAGSYPAGSIVSSTQVCPTAGGGAFSYSVTFSDGCSAGPTNYTVTVSE